MVNLAGVKTCDETMKKELDEAGIEVVYIGRTDREVPASIIGKCNNFIFTRAWYYWVVSGYMPLVFAKEMYEKYKDLNIRVAGHCGNPPPEEWCEPKDYSKKCEPYMDRMLKDEITAYEANEICRKIRKQGNQFVTSYHIDSQEGLNRFVETVKKYGIIG